MLIFLILFVVAVVFYFFFYRKFKVPKLNAVVMVTGGVKTGKSTMSVYFVKKEYKKRLRAYKLHCFFCKLFHRSIQREKPLIYSNVPLGLPYVQLTREHLLRKYRFNYGSVVYIQEASLVNDSQLIKDKDINNRLLLFYKLFGHETKGGICIADTQTISDVHYSQKRVLSEFYYIHSLVRFIPFFLVANVIETRYSEDTTLISDTSKDIEEHLKRVLIPKSTWKLFDCYCYSPLTDNLPVKNDIICTKDLKIKEIISFRKEFSNLCEKEK